MREIKFRVWRDNKMLYYKDFSKLCYGNLFLSMDGVVQEDECHDGCVPVDGAIPLQYTGKKDSKGTEIYNGDIISDGNADAIGAVSFSESEGIWLISTESGQYFLYEALGKKDCVIGNIYENPELLNA